MNAVLIHPSVPTADAITLLPPITVSVIRVSQEMGKLAAVRSFFPRYLIRTDARN